MKVILVGVLLIASAGLAAAQDVQPVGPRIYVIARSTTGATLEFNAAEQRENVLYVENVTITIGDLAVTADDATLERTEVKLGNNARVILPTPESVQSTNRPSYLIPVSTTRYTIPSTTGATVQFDSRDWPESVTKVPNAILTFGDLVIRADDATLEQTEIKLGANARLILPPRIRTTN
jgi:hypothetical protein